MNFKTILLGSAAALAVTGVQAADMPMTPEPVDYVRVCDAFGSGYWYIPGTETCIKLGGRARFEVLLHDSAAVDTAGTYGGISASVYVSSTNAWAYGSAYVYGSVSHHYASWEFRSNGMLSTSVKSMTEYGVLNGYIELSFNQDNNGKDDAVHVDHVFLELGHVLMGHTDSTFNYGGGFTFDGSNHGNTETDQIRLNWAMNGFGLMLGLEDPRDRWSSSIGDYDMPDIVGAITADHGTWDAKLSLGYASGSIGDAWAIQLGATFKLDSLHAGDQLRLKAGYGNTDGYWCFGNSFLGTDGCGDSVYFMASYKHNWSDTLSSAFTYSYSDSDSSPDENQFAANLVWAPVTGFSAGAEALYKEQGGYDSWSGKFRIQRTW